MADLHAINSRCTQGWGLLRSLLFDDAALDAIKTLVSEDVPALLAEVDQMRGERDQIARQRDDLLARFDDRRVLTMREVREVFRTDPTPVVEDAR